MILLLGAEINAFFAEGVRVTPNNLAVMIHELTSHLPTSEQAVQQEAAVSSSPRASATRPGARGEYADAPVAPEEVQQMVAKSVEGLTPPNVFVAYTKSAARP